MTTFGCLRREANRTLPLLQSRVGARKGLRQFLRNESSFIPKRVLVVAKVSRYYFERLRESNISENRLKLKLLDRGSDYDAMLASHHANKKAEMTTVEVLRRMNIEYKVIDRLSIDRESFAWADFVLPIGGDGTFLLASNLMYDNVTPIMGINSDPVTSEGFLMLPSKYSRNIPEVFEMLKAGQFKFLMRSRIRITLKGEGIWNAPFHMHEKCRVAGDERYTPIYTDKDSAMENNYINWFYVHEPSNAVPKADLPKERRLPWLALNEVFIGESLSARTSTLQLNMDDEDKFYKIKSSGLCVSTGTGSTSWHRAINSLNVQIIKDILSIADKSRTYSEEQLGEICAAFNKNLQFPAEDPRIAYTIRDAIQTGVRPLPKRIQPRDFCNKLTVRSQCFDAGLVLDGGIAVPFNDGTIATLQIHPEDALRTVVLPE